MIARGWTSRSTDAIYDELAASGFGLSIGAVSVRIHNPSAAGRSVFSRRRHL